KVARCDPPHQWCGSGVRGRQSRGGRRRKRLVWDRRRFASCRRRTDPRGGFVGRRRRGGGASPARTTFASFAAASSRLRSWERCSDALTVSTPPVSCSPSRVRSRSRCPAVRTAEVGTAHESSARVSEVFTCCPPGPEEREKRHWSSAAGMTNSADTCTSTPSPCHTSTPRQGPYTRIGALPSVFAAGYLPFSDRRRDRCDPRGVLRFAGHRVGSHPLGGHL